MGERRRKCATLLLKFPGKTTTKLEFFPAEEWPGETGAAAGSVRIRRDLAWVCPGGAKYGFLGRQAVGAYLAGLLAGDQVLDETPPNLRARTRVRVTLRKPTFVPDEGMDLDSDMDISVCMITTTELSFTVSPVFQGIDGQWRVCVAACDEPVLVSQVEEIP